MADYNRRVETSSDDAILESDVGVGGDLGAQTSSDDDILEPVDRRGGDLNAQPDARSGRVENPEIPNFTQFFIDRAMTLRRGVRHVFESYFSETPLTPADWYREDLVEAIVALDVNFDIFMVSNTIDEEGELRQIGMPLNATTLDSLGDTLGKDDASEYGAMNGSSGSTLDPDSMITITFYPKRRASGTACVDLAANDKYTMNPIVAGYLERWQVLTDDEAKSENVLPCLVQALMLTLAAAGDAMGESEILEACAPHLCYGSVKTEDLGHIADTLNITIRLTCAVDMEDGVGISIGRETAYNEYNGLTVVHIGHYHNHYIANDKPMVVDPITGKSTPMRLDDFNISQMSPGHHNRVLKTALPAYARLKYSHSVTVCDDAGRKLRNMRYQTPEPKLFTQSMINHSDKQWRKQYAKSLYQSVEDKEAVPGMVRKEERRLRGLRGMQRSSFRAPTVKPLSLCHAFADNTELYMFDVETYVRLRDRKVIPFSVSVRMSLGRTETHFGPTCIENAISSVVTEFRRVNAKRLLDNLPAHRRPVLAAHNLKFDFATVISKDNMLSLDVLIGRTSDLKAATITWGYDATWVNADGETEVTGTSQKIDFRDTACLFRMSVADIGAAFALPVSKATLPYGYFTEERVLDLESGGDNWYGRRSTLTDFAVGVSADTLRAGCIGKPFYCAEDDSVNLHGYVVHYNELDVVVPYEGWRKMANIYESEYDFEIFSKLTIGSIGQGLALDNRCYTNTPEVYGALSEFMRKHVVGGWVHLLDNEPQISDPKDTDVRLADYDVNSEYPWAQSQGIPAGFGMLLDQRQVDLAATIPDYYDSDGNQLRSVPLDVQQAQLYVKKFLPQDIERVGSYTLTTVRVIRLPKVCKSDMSYVQYQAKGKGREFIKSIPEGATVEITADQDMIRILEDYQGLIRGFHYVVTSAIHYPALDPTLSDLTAKLYRDRNLSKLVCSRAQKLITEGVDVEANKLKRDGGKALGSLLKACLNNIWGKTCQRTFNETHVIESTWDDGMKYMLEHPNRCITLRRIPESNKCIIHRFKKSTPVFHSRCQVGHRVLGKSKMLLASHHHVFQLVGLKVIYGDTDSVHVLGITPEKVANYRTTFESLFGYDPVALEQIDTGLPDPENPGFNILAMVDKLGSMKSDYGSFPGIVPDNVSYRPQDIYACQYAYLHKKSYACTLAIPTSNGVYYTTHVRFKGVTKNGLADAIDRFPGPDKVAKTMNLYRDMGNPDTPKQRMDMLHGGGITVKYTAGGSFMPASQFRSVGLGPS